ncbi:MAG: rhomboid family intramembrane serine protease [Chitinophagales bacterium]|nr:rhomboid family intramembrane serine protease [Chitinophagales bacterium]HAE13028.1 rhomboid family intramembrane serine protease [Bacteroidota bacterium]MCB9019106.1 rhomboid family intramembrane serine protease [Chitinophagales bacterium]MCB9021885.1 rhomboid family intramembrane serine protease [Chitinophagales bacterium]MCB9030864.1 rhomboid family intramembrane serine protease [Chitinophagales bacterium]
MSISLTIIIIALTVITSMMAFNNPVMKGSALFYPHAISARGEWYRFLTSGFIHADWMHLLVNMYVLYIFGDILEHYLLPLYFHQKTRLVYLAIYLGGMIVSDIPSYFKHRHDSLYRALGASGAVSSIVFAGILINPWQGGIGLLFLPGITLPPVVFGGLYLLYSAIMARRQSDNVNHDAHFYGALFGLILPGILQPEIFTSFFYQIMNRL